MEGLACANLVVGNMHPPHLAAPPLPPFPAVKSTLSKPNHMQIDSHMRFVKGWDTALLRMLHQAGCAAGHPRVVLSHYPPGYEVRLW